MIRYEALHEMAQAIKKGEIPTQVVSPGFAAELLGMTRQAVWERVQNGSLKAWVCEGVILVDMHDLLRLDKVRKDKQSARSGGGGARGVRRTRGARSLS